MANYNTSSPYYATGYSQFYLDAMVNRPIPRETDDLEFEINQTYQYRPDLLAFDLYNDARLWWVFAARNPNRLGPDPYFDFKAGVGIYVPTQTGLNTALGL